MPRIMSQLWTEQSLKNTNNVAVLLGKRPTAAADCKGNHRPSRAIIRIFAFSVPSFHKQIRNNKKSR